MISSYTKQEIIWPDAGGLDASALIPFELGGTMMPSKPVVSVMDLGKMLLHCAREGETAQVRDLMSRGAPFTTDWLGTSPLHVAANNNHHDTCDALIKAGISKNARTKVDRTPLHFAVYEGHEDIVRLLLKHDCEVDAKDMLRMTPLHWAVEKRRARIAEQLLRHGADPSCRSKFEKTPLSIALATGQTAIYEELLAAKMRIGDPEQQRAADSLVFELNRSRATEEAAAAAASIAEGAEQAAVPMTSDSYATDSDHLSDQDRLNANGMEIDESLSRLQSADGTKTNVDTSTLQILKDHGIAMLEDTDGTLLNSALQNGRRLVLSDAGKMILNDPKYKPMLMRQPQQQQPPASNHQHRPSQASASHAPSSGNNSSSTSPHKQPANTFVPGMPLQQQHHQQQAFGASSSSTQQPPIRFEAMRKKPTIIMPPGSRARPPMAGASNAMQTVPNAASATLPLKTNKVIKILSAEEFKQMCGANAAAGNTLKKISTESLQKGALKYQTITNSNILTQLTKKKPILNKFKLGTLTQAAKNSMLNEIKITGIKPINHHPQLHKLVPSTSTAPASHASALDPDTEYISRLSHNQAKAAAAAAAAATSAAASTAQPANVQMRTIGSHHHASNHHHLPHSNSSAAVSRHAMSPSDVERQLLDLRKQIEDLRRQFELSQKQNAEYRTRIERLERDRDEERQHYDG